MPIPFLLLLFLAATPWPSRAQEWTLDAYAGRATYDPVSANVGTSNGVLGVRYGGEGGEWFYLSAAAPFAAGDAVWGALGLGHRFAVGANHLSAGLDLGAQGYGYRDPMSTTFGAGAIAQALPFAAVEQGAVRLEIRSGVMHSVNTFSGLAESRTIHDSGARLILSGSLPLELAAEGRYVRAEEGNYPYAGGSASMRHGRGEIWAGVGRWFSDALPGLSWGVGASIDIGQHYAVWAAIREESSHPLYWNDSRQSWNVGVSRRLGKAVHSSAPVPAPAEISAGVVTIRVPVSESESGLYVAGDFTGWNPVSMTRTGEHWTVSLPVGPGFHHYAFRTRDGRWFVPESMPGRRDDGFGGHVAVLVVP